MGNLNCVCRKTGKSTQPPHLPDAILQYPNPSPLPSPLPSEEIYKKTVIPIGQSTPNPCYERKDIYSFKPNTFHKCVTSSGLPRESQERFLNIYTKKRCMGHYEDINALHSPKDSV